MTTVGIATGAGRGMGLACAERLVDMVDTVLLVDRDEAAATAAADSLAIAAPGAVEPVVAGITEPHAAADAALDEPLDGALRDRIHDALGPAIEDPRSGCDRVLDRTCCSSKARRRSQGGRVGSAAEEPALEDVGRRVDGGR